MRKVWVIIIGITGVLIGFAGCYSVKEESMSVCFTSPAWTPDGKKLYFIKDIGYSRTVVENKPFGKELYEFRDEWYLMKCNPDGSDTMNVARIYKQKEWLQGALYESYRVEMDISPSGEIVINFLDPPGIFLMDTTGQILGKVLDWGKNPRWAFNYTKIIFTGDDEHPGIWMMDKDGNNLEKLVEKGESPIKLQSVCKTTNEILFSVEWDKKLCAYSFQTETTDTIKGLRGKRFLTADWNKKGDKIAIVSNLYCYLTPNDTLFYQVYNRELDSIVVLKKRMKEAYFLRWSPEGEWLVFWSSTLWRIKWDGTQIEKLF